MWNRALLAHKDHKWVIYYILMLGKYPLKIPRHFVF